MSTCETAFASTFKALTGHKPFPWQERLYARFLSERDDNIPRTCNLPTGLGKTSVIAVWLIALADGAKVPRRLVYVVNRRTVVDQTTREAEKLRAAVTDVKCLQEDAQKAESLETLLGIEGNAARAYFENFAGMIKLDEPGQASENGAEFTFDFLHRNRRPPRDPVNALLSLAYSVLAKDLTVVCHTVGFDPFLGFYHQPRFGRAALPLDLMEPFRPLVADSAVLSAINTRMVTARESRTAGSTGWHFPRLTSRGPIEVRHADERSQPNIINTKRRRRDCGGPIVIGL